MKIEYLDSDVGRACYTRGHVPLGEFMAQLLREADESDPMLTQQPEHTWLRFTRDFSDGILVLGETKPGRGAFAVTYIFSDSLVW